MASELSEIRPHLIQGYKVSLLETVQIVQKGLDGASSSIYHF